MTGLNYTIIFLDLKKNTYKNFFICKNFFIYVMSILTQNFKLNYMESFNVDVRERDGKPSYGRPRTVSLHLKLHKSKRWFAMKIRHLGGYMIIRIKTDGKLGRRNKWGSPFGYFGYSNTFINAIRKAKKEHKVKIPVNDWVTVRCKSYHSFDSLQSHYDNIVEELKTIVL